MGTSSCIVNNILRNLLWASVFATDINHRIYKAVCPNKGCKGECVYYPPPRLPKNGYLFDSHPNVTAREI